MSRFTTRQKPSTGRTNQTEGPLRLQKILASAGLGSRRDCEALILAGRVEVDRRVVSELGAKADPARQEIRVDGVNLPKPQLVYFAVNKPPGVVCTNSDPSGRPRAIDLVPHGGRLFTVGRLDMSSEGLILVTNDGELADRLTHPRYGVEKTYRVEVAGRLERSELGRLRRGVHLAEGFARVASARVVRAYKQSTMLEIVLAEGRNREIRRVLARAGHKVERLKRTAIGPLRLADLPSGQSRPLQPDELARLKRFAAARPGSSRANRSKAPKAAKTPAAATKRQPTRSIIGADKPSRGARAGNKSASRGTGSVKTRAKQGRPPRKVRSPKP